MLRVCHHYTINFWDLSFPLKCYDRGNVYDWFTKFNGKIKKTMKINIINLLQQSTYYYNNLFLKSYFLSQIKISSHALF